MMPQTVKQWMNKGQFVTYMSRHYGIGFEEAERRWDDLLSHLDETEKRVNDNDRAAQLLVTICQG